MPCFEQREDLFFFLQDPYIRLRREVSLPSSGLAGSVNVLHSDRYVPLLLPLSFFCNFNDFLV